jgi:hypothetical protein
MNEPNNATPIGDSDISGVSLVPMMAPNGKGFDEETTNGENSDGQTNTPSTG